jgi:hypothetical protein
VPGSEAGGSVRLIETGGPDNGLIGETDGSGVASTGDAVGVEKSTRESVGEAKCPSVGKIPIGFSSGSTDGKPGGTIS